MPKHKVLITMEGGMIQSVASTIHLDIVINDYDNPEEEGQIIRTEIDELFRHGEAHKLIKENGYPLSSAEQLIKAYLKEEKF